MTIQPETNQQQRTYVASAGPGSHHFTFYFLSEVSLELWHKKGVNCSLATHNPLQFLTFDFPGIFDAIRQSFCKCCEKNWQRCLQTDKTCTLYFLLFTFYFLHYRKRPYSHLCFLVWSWLYLWIYRTLTLVVVYEIIPYHLVCGIVFDCDLYWNH